jgi:hypothetical protein
LVRVQICPDLIAGRLAAIWASTSEDLAIRTFFRMKPNGNHPTAIHDVLSQIIGLIDRQAFVLSGP